VAPSDEPHLQSGDSAEEPDAVLRAKYLDYCSARISEVFLSLSDNRIYEMVEEAARESGQEPGGLGSREMVRLVTRKLQESVPLPDYREWVEDYRQNPERYDPFLLGFWEEELNGQPSGAGSEHDGS
jgi:hypothetical protein